MPITLPLDTRYGSPTALNFSSLARYVTYDYLGDPTYNMYAFLNPPPFNVTDVVLIGRIVDEHFTEGILVDDNYTKEKWRTVDQYKEILSSHIEERNLKVSKWKKDDYQAFFVELFGDEVVDTRMIIAPGVYDTIIKVIQSHDNFQYDANRTTLQLFSECETQKVVTSLSRKGKLDFYHKDDNLVIDLKIVGNLERFTEEIHYRGEYKIYHRYCRQLSFYDNLCGGGHDGQLIVTDHNGNHNIFHFPNSILRKSQELNERDIKILEKQLQSPSFFTQLTSPSSNSFDSII